MLIFIAASLEWIVEASDWMIAVVRRIVYINDVEKNETITRITETHTGYVVAVKLDTIAGWCL